MNQIVQFLLGGALLIAGRRLFWLFVGAVGFFIGLTYAGRYFQGQPDWIILIFAIILGIIGALLAIFLQGLAVGLAGFLAGGYVLQAILGIFGVTDQTSLWIAFLVGGVIGVLLIAVLFDWALILLSSLVGSMFVVQALALVGLTATLVFLVLVLFGIVIQARMRPAGHTVRRRSTYRRRRAL